MKAVTSSLNTLMLVVLVLVSALDVHAQGRGNGNNKPGRGNQNENHMGKEYDRDRNYDYDHGRDDDRRYGNRDDKNGNRGNQDRKYHNPAPKKYKRYSSYKNPHRYITYQYHRQRHPSWAPAYGYRYNTRYIYYQDYNVYYDCHRDVFLTWTGRNWVVNTRIPDFMFHVDFRSARVSGVDYWDDDFDFYLQRTRPSYLSISAGW